MSLLSSSSLKTLVNIKTQLELTFLLVVKPSYLCLGVEAGHDVLGARDGGVGPAPHHAGRSAPLQLPHGSGESEHQSVALLQQSQVLLRHFLTPKHSQVITSYRSFAINLLVISQLQSFDGHSQLLSQTLLPHHLS